MHRADIGVRRGGGGGGGRIQYKYYKYDNHVFTVYLCGIAEGYEMSHVALDMRFVEFYMKSVFHC